MPQAFNPFNREKLDGPDDNTVWDHTEILAETGNVDQGPASAAEQDHVSRIVTAVLRLALEQHDDRPVEAYLMGLPEEDVEALDPELFLAANELAIICLTQTLRRVAVELTGTDTMRVLRDSQGRVNLIFGNTLPPSLHLTPGDPANG